MTPPPLGTSGLFALPNEGGTPQMCGTTFKRFGIHMKLLHQRVGGVEPVLPVRGWRGSRSASVLG